MFTQIPNSIRILLVVQQRARLPRCVAGKNYHTECRWWWRIYFNWRKTSADVSFPTFSTHSQILVSFLVKNRSISYKLQGDMILHATGSIPWNFLNKSNLGNDTNEYSLFETFMCKWNVKCWRVFHTNCTRNLLSNVKNHIGLYFSRRFLTCNDTRICECALFFVSLYFLFNCFGKIFYFEWPKQVHWMSKPYNEHGIECVWLPLIFVE